jgi:arginine:pyruvate transaminase
VRFSPLVDRIAGPAAWRVNMRGRELAAQGRQIIFLTVGDPDSPPPAPVLRATIQALEAGRTHYSPIVGYPAVRQAVAARHAGQTQVATDADQIVLVPGAQAGLFAALACIAGPGDEVIVPEPIYATYAAVAGVSGATLVTVPLRPERGFHLDPDDLARAVTPRTRVVWINSPHNPTGAVMTRDEVEAVADLCRRHDLWCLSDEVYAELAFERPHVSPYSLPAMAERTVVVSSLSKSHAMSGFRFGWIVGPRALAGHLFNLILCMLYGGPPFIQDGALVALTEDLPDVARMRENYRRRAALMVDRLANCPGVRAMAPEGGMFVLLDVRGTGVGASDFALDLLERESVAVLPCDGFGPSAAGHLRLSLTADDAVLVDVAARIQRHARATMLRHP